MYVHLPGTPRHRSTITCAMTFSPDMRLPVSFLITSRRVYPRSKPSRIRVQMDCSCVQFATCVGSGDRCFPDWDMSLRLHGCVLETPCCNQPLFHVAIAGTIEPAWAIAHFPIFLQASHTVGTSTVIVLWTDSMNLHEVIGGLSGCGCCLSECRADRGNDLRILALDRTTLPSRHPARLPRTVPRRHNLRPRTLPRAS